MNIKHLLVSFAFILLVKVSVGQSLLKVGDNIYSYLRENPVKYNKPNNKMNNWAEGTIGFYSYTKGRESSTPYILHSCEGKFLIGVLQGTKPNAYYLIDLDGDGVLDYKTATFVMPTWVIEANSPTHSKENNLYPLIEVMYESFNSDLGPSNPKMIGALTTIMTFYKDTTLANRDLICMLDFYIKNVNKPEIAMYAISKLEVLYEERFSKTHPLLNLYKGETYMNLGENDLALIEFKKILETDKNFVPALVYLFQLEKKTELSEKNLKQLKTNYPDHWIVKNL